TALPVWALTAAVKTKNESYLLALLQVAWIVQAELASVLQFSRRSDILNGLARTVRTRPLHQRGRGARHAGKLDGLRKRCRRGNKHSENRHEDKARFMPHNGSFLSVRKYFVLAG